MFLNILCFIGCLGCMVRFGGLGVVMMVCFIMFIIYERMMAGFEK